MKVTVEKNFRDKYTHQQYKAGDVIDISAERYTEILDRGEYVKKVPTPRKKRASQKETPEEVTPHAE